jgi:hypothetical protein
MFLDSRLGNTPRWFLYKPKDWNMRVPDETIKSVVFIGRLLESGGQIDAKFSGTGFFVQVPSAQVNTRAYNYLVTAKHVANAVSLKHWFIRANVMHPTDDGSYFGTFLGNENVRWWFHPTEADIVDVAVMPFPIPPNIDYSVVPESMFVNQKVIEEVYVGPGDEVVISGLFTRITGSKKNLPIIRVGNISLLSEPGELWPGVTMLEPTADGERLEKRHVKSEFHLIEARSIGGLSGSPVFVRSSVPVKVPLQRLAGGVPVNDVVNEHWCAMTGPVLFLGLVHGHWEIPAEEKNEIYPQDDITKKKDVVNVGLAVVVPAKKILEVLYHPELVRQRHEYDEEYLASLGTTTPD